MAKNTPVTQWNMHRTLPRPPYSPASCFWHPLGLTCQKIAIGKEDPSKTPKHLQTYSLHSRCTKTPLHMSAKGQLTSLATPGTCWWHNADTARVHGMCESSSRLTHPMNCGALANKNSVRGLNNSLLPALLQALNVNSRPSDVPSCPLELSVPHPRVPFHFGFEGGRGALYRQPYKYKAMQKQTSISHSL